MRAVRALQAWLQQAEIHHGPGFRQMRRGDKLTNQRLSDQSVALIIKRRAQTADLSPELLSGHSLRAGYATAAAAAGVEERKIANITRHKNIKVLRGYIRRATALRRHRRSAVGPGGLPTVSRQSGARVDGLHLLAAEFAPSRLGGGRD